MLYSSLFPPLLQAISQFPVHKSPTGSQYKGRLQDISDVLFATPLRSNPLLSSPTIHK